MSDNVIPLPRDDDLPGSLSGFMERFPDNESCAAFLRLWRYGPKGFACPRCGGTSAWFLPAFLDNGYRDCGLLGDRFDRWARPSSGSDALVLS